MTTYKVRLLKLTVRVKHVPHDMMRYDNCVPASESDSHKLERIADGAASKEDHDVVFKMFDVSGRGPAYDRWLSFGCVVIKSEAWV